MPTQGRVEFLRSEHDETCEPEDPDLLDERMATGFLVLNNHGEEDDAQLQPRQCFSVKVER